jgi:hypothetical protein
MTKNTKNTKMNHDESKNIMNDLIVNFSVSLTNYKKAFYELAGCGLAYVLENQQNEKQAYTELTNVLKNQYTESEWVKARGAECRKISYIKKVYESRIDKLKELYTIDSGDYSKITQFLIDEKLTQAVVLYTPKNNESTDKKGESDNEKTHDESTDNQEKTMTPEARIKRILDDITEIKKNAKNWIALRDSLVARFNLSLQSDNGLKDLYKTKKAD